ncbi:unnamed protein product [Didymodactylos carnosus]|uniref:Uncharacterized protein n=1 Tax=Didymodactylos carnosus TaxID=1234261 RepID=A0A815K5X3_9BILA|nr:unnamed protein product [Didymodactylos carnosus]CAF1388962.1 unnamed protein product [Didymodactylos carnosus]CAF3653826.1 unnamed protein product [Didymodactylos carnosus]CAF4283697.1 unnamed protein product [Didymodactylos carnosus]
MSLSDQSSKPNGDWTNLLRNKVVFLTGGGGHIGRSIAHTCFLHGAKVVVGDVNLQAANDTTKQISAENQDRLLSVHLDVTDENSIKHAVKVGVDKWNAIDILVNCAAAFNVGIIENVSDSDWDTVYKINIKGIALMIKEVVPIMKKQRSGSIINISSAAGIVAIPAFLPYATTKGALIQMSRNLALDLGQYNIRVNSISPGAVDTPTLVNTAKALNMTKEEFDNANMGKCLKRYAHVQEIVNMVVFLASDLCTFCTGSNVIVDGGYTVV